MPGAMTGGGTGVKRSESLKSNRSDLSHKKVSFNKDVSVKHIPRGAFVDRNGKLIAVMPESADPKVWFASRKAERLNADDIAREAQEILTQLDQVTCAASPVPFHEHPHASHRSPSSATTATTTTTAAPRNNMYSHPGTYSKSLPSPHKKNNIESKNNKLRNVVDKNKINKDFSKDKGSTSSTEKRRKSLETILETGGHNGYIDFNSLSKTSSLNNVNESAFSDNDIMSNHKMPKKVVDRTSPIRDTNKETEPLHFQDVQGNSAVRALVSRFNEESQRRHDSSAGGMVPMVGITEPSRDNNHNNNQPFSYLRPSNSPPDLSTKAEVFNYDHEGVDEVDNEDYGEQLRSPREVVYAQVVVNNKDKPTKTTVHTKVANTKTTNIKEQKWQERDSSINRSYSNADKKYVHSRTESPDRFQPSTYPRPRDRSKSPSKYTEGRVYGNSNARAKSPAKVQTRISNDASGRTKIYLTREELKRNPSNVSTQQKHVARVNINGTSSPRKASPAADIPEKRYYYGDNAGLSKTYHRTATKSNSDSSIKTNQQHKKVIKTNSDTSNNHYSNSNELTSMRLVKEASARSKPPRIVVTSSDDGHKGTYAQSEGEDKKRKKVKITFHDKPSRTDSDIEKLKGFTEYRGNSDKEEKIRRSRKHFFSAFLEKAPRGPLNFKKKEAKTKTRRASDPLDSDSQMVWSSPGEETDDVLRYTNSDSGHRAAPKMWFSSEDVGWSERVEDSSLERPTHKSRVPDHSSRSHSLDRRSKSPRVVAHRSPSYLSRMGRYFSETDRESASQLSENESSRLTRRRRAAAASMGELSEGDRRHRRGAAASMERLNDTDMRHKRRNGEVSTEELSENEGQRRRRHKLKRSVSSAAILHQRKPVSSTGSTANSSESENGTTSGNSGRSVYLHAITVANIPPPPNEGGGSVLSKDEILERPGRQRQSRSVTRSSSVVGPWKPRPKEPLEINYASNTSNGRPPRPPRRREKMQANATTEQIGEGANPVRRVHTTKDGARIAGWFRRKKREPSPSATPQPKQDIRHR